MVGELTLNTGTLGVFATSAVFWLAPLIEAGRGSEVIEESADVGGWFPATGGGGAGSAAFATGTGNLVLSGAGGAGG